MITFPRARYPESGTGLDPAYFRSISDAINARLASGLGDGFWRIFIYLLSLYRQIRNPDASGNQFPSLHEFFSHYLHVDPNDGTWPLTEAGDPEGANLGNPASAWVFGTGADWLSEGDRLSARIEDGQLKGILLELPSPFSLKDVYINGQYQRGGYDPVQQKIHAPALDCAQMAFDLYPGENTFHGKSFGGYMPIPRTDPVDCYDSTNNRYYPSYYYFVTDLQTGQRIEFSGSCHPDHCQHDDCSDDVAFFSEDDRYIYVLQYNGNLSRFDKRRYIAGPFDGGGGLRRNHASAFRWLFLSNFVSSFAGTDEQRTGECLDIRSIAFDFQDFLTRPYALAPAYGTWQNNQLVVDYPVLTLPEQMSSGSFSTALESPHELFCLGPLYISGSLQSNLELEIFEQGVHRETIQLPSGNEMEKIHVPWYCLKQTIQFRPVRSLNAGEKIHITHAFILQYYPTIEDAYVVIRCSSADETRGISSVDYHGAMESQASQLFENFRTYGCIVNLRQSTGISSQISAINTNPVFESSRKFLREIVKFVPADALLGYEVQENRSILYFKRNWSVGSLTIDPWHGMLDEAGNDQITHQPEDGQWSNEWFMDLSLKPFSNSESSIWKPSVYGDYFPMISRQHLLSNDLPPDVFKQIQSPQSIPASSYFGNEVPYSPEALSVLNFDRNNWQNINSYSEEQREWFIRSSPIYKRPYYVKSCESVIFSNQSAVKVTLERRLLCSQSAYPGPIPASPAIWNQDWYRNDSYRTDENGIMEYLQFKHSGLVPLLKTGDLAWSANPASAENLKGCIWPSFVFLKAVPFPASKALPESLWHRQAVLYVRAMCEGFVSGRHPFQCDSWALNDIFDFKFSDLCYDAFGKSSLFGPIPEDLRHQDPLIGYGPLPNTDIYADFLKKLASMVNLLDTVRVPLPFSLKTRSKIFSGEQILPESLTPAYGTVDCSNQAVNRVIFLRPGIIPPVQLQSVGEWQDASQVFSYDGVALCFECQSGRFKMCRFKQVDEFRFELVDARYLLALDDAFVENVLYGENGFFGQLLRQDSWHEADLVYSSEESYDCDCGYPFFSSEGIGYKIENKTRDLDSCIYASNGVLSANLWKDEDHALCFNLPNCDPKALGSFSSLMIIPTRTGTLYAKIPLIPNGSWIRPD